jgi:hypothetical protein
MDTANVRMIHLVLAGSVMIGGSSYRHHKVCYWQ